MTLCHGTRAWWHDEIVHDGNCPACDEHEKFLIAEAEIAAHQEARDEAEAKLSRFETDLAHAMRMIRDAKRVVEAEEGAR